MKQVSVLKFGGSSVGTIDKIKDISTYLKKRVENNEKLIVVVSAMGKTTDELLKQVEKITDNPDVRELDTLLAIGEQNTISLMAITLNELGVRARSLTGIQAGIKTFGQHTKSRIADIDADFLNGQLEGFDILVVAGFQGYNENLEITTLGRGGSDTSAVALAAAIGASCEIYTDVTGVFGTDPRIYKAARQLSQVSYEEMLELSALGAGVLETRCVEIAKNYNVPLYLAKTLSDTKGTWIMANTDLLEKKVVTGVALDRDILHVTLTCSDIGTNFVEELFNQVSIVGSGMRDVSGVAARAFRLLCSNGINFYQVTTSEISISYAIDKDISEKAVILLCKEFNI